MCRPDGGVKLIAPRKTRVCATSHLGPASLHLGLPVSLCCYPDG